MREYDERTHSALYRLLAQLDPNDGNALIDQLDTISDAAAEQWRAMFDVTGDTPAEAVIPSGDRPRRPGAGVSILPDDEDEDDAHPDAAAASTSVHVQT